MRQVVVESVPFASVVHRIDLIRHHMHVVVTVLRWSRAEVPRILILMYLGLGTYSLGTYSLAQPILDLATHSLH